MAIYLTKIEEKQHSIVFQNVIKVKIHKNKHLFLLIYLKFHDCNEWPMRIFHHIICKLYSFILLNKTGYLRKNCPMIGCHEGSPS